MHSRTEEDYRTELLLWILIDAFAERGYIEPEDFHTSAIRYKRELARRGMELNIYPDLVTDRSREVDDAAVQAMEYGLLGPQRPGSAKAPITGRVGPFLRPPREGEPSLTADEISLAREAARLAYEAWSERRLEDDLPKKSGASAATS